MWRFVSVFVCLTLLLVPVARADKVVLVADPQTSTPAINLLEHSLIAVLRQNNHEVVTPEPSSTKVRRARRQLAQANGMRATARASFEQLELDAALKQYTSALTKLERWATVTPTLEPLADTLLMLSACQLLLGQERRARAVLERLLILQSDIQPDEALFNPHMMAVFDGVASQVRAEPVTDMEISVDPPGAVVYFDGRLVGTAPVTVSGVKRGRHYVTATAKGFDPNGRTVEIKARTGNTISLRLTEARTNPGLQSRLAAIVAGIGGAEPPSELHALARQYGADTTLVLVIGDTHFEMVRVDTGGERTETSSKRTGNDVGSALRTAVTLLGPLAAATPNLGPEHHSDAGPDTAEDAGTRSSGGDVALNMDHHEALGSGLFSEHPTKNTTLWVAYGSALGLATAGGVFGSLALLAQNEFGKESMSDAIRFDPDETTDQTEGEAIKESGERNALLADVLFGAAAAALVTGVCLHLLWEPEAAELKTSAMQDSPTLRWSVGPGTLRIDF